VRHDRITKVNPQGGVMRAVWGGFCALALFGAIQASGWSNDRPPNKDVSQYFNFSSNVAFTQPTRIVKQDSRLPEPSNTLSSSAIVLLIIQQSRTAYYATGHPCACPDDKMRNGRRCGGNSAYSKPGGATPKCYPNDVTAEDINNFLAQR
jgi:hypothetical protein